MAALYAASLLLAALGAPAGCSEELKPAARARWAAELGCAAERVERRADWYGHAVGCTDVADEWHGAVRAFWDNGRPKHRGGYDHGRRHGRWRIWRRDGTKKEQGRFVRGRRHGAWSFFAQSHKVSDGHYRDDAKHGRWTYYAPDGRRIASGTLEREQRSGQWVTWDAKNRRCQGRMQAGRKVGEWICFHGPEPEQRWAAGRYVDGREHGRWRVWSPDGRLRRQGRYRLGERVGTWLDYGPDGEVVARTVYRDGQVVRAERRAPAGEPQPAQK